MMDEAQEIPMDSIVSFKSGKSIRITKEQTQIFSHDHLLNLLVSSNRYGYVFYATETDGLVLIPSALIDDESRYLSKSAEDDDNVDNNENVEKFLIIHRSFIPGQSKTNDTSIIPQWLSLNCDEKILSIILLQVNTQSYFIYFYDVVQLVQMENPTPICSPLSFSKNSLGGGINNFTWNPAIPNIFAFINGNGAVSTYTIDQDLKPLGKSPENNNNASICWSSKGKQIVVATYEGDLALYEPNMTLKKNYSSPVKQLSFPPCISIIWLSTYQFLLGFSEDDPDQNTNNPYSFTYVAVTFDKDQNAKTQIYYDLFHDAQGDNHPQFYFSQLNQSKIIFCGLSKSLKINVLGQNEPNQDFFDVWSFDDACRATVKSSTTVDNKRPILTGMAIGLNSTLKLSDGKQQFSQCPILLLSNSEGLLQIYYYMHEGLPSLYRKPEIIDKNPQSTSSIVSQITNRNSFPNFDSLTNFQVTNSSRTDNLKKILEINNSTQNLSTKISTTLNKKLFQKVEEFQSQLNLVKPPSTQSSELLTNIDHQIDDLINQLTYLTTKLQNSIQLMKTMTCEHIQSMTKIEDAQHKIKLSQKENLYHFLKDRELDPWTQKRLDGITTKYDKLKHNLNVILQLTKTTFHDKSSITDENEDFLPDLEISINQNETMKGRLHKDLLDLSHKVTETDKDLELICSKIDTDLLNNKPSNSTFTKPSNPFQSLDEEIFSYLKSNHSKINQIQVPSAIAINLTETIQQKQSTISETTKQDVPLLEQLSTPKQSNVSSNENESHNNVLRYIRTAIDLVNGSLSPEQMQELSSMISKSPLLSTNIPPTTQTPTLSKTTNLPKSSTEIKSSIATPSQQTPAKSVSSPIPAISVTPATPAGHISSPTVAVPPTITHLTKSTSGDTTIRLLLNNTNRTQQPNPQALNLANKSVTPGGLWASQTPGPSSSSTGVLSTTESMPLISGQSLMNSAALRTQLPTTTLIPAQSTSNTTVFTTAQSTSSTASTMTQPPFGGARTTVPSGFNTIATINQSTFDPTATGTSSPFSTTRSTNQPPPFGAPPTTTSQSPFGGTLTTTTSQSRFGALPTTTTSQSPFGGTSTTTTSQSPFGALPTTTTSQSPFGGTSTTTTSQSPFGTLPTTTTSQSPFGGTSTTTTSQSPFGALPTTTTSQSPFGGTSTTTTSQSPFGAPPTTTSQSPFGGTSTTTTSQSPFGALLTTTGQSPFGAPPPTTSQSPFGGTSTRTTTQSIFGATTQSPFGASLTTETQSPFGGASTAMTSVQSTSPTIKPITSSANSGFGSRPTFGGGASNLTVSNLSTNLFGSSTGTGSTSIFGGFSSVSGPTSTPTASGFGSPSTTPSTGLPINSNFSTATTTTGTNSFGSGSSNTIFPGFGSNPTAPSNSIFGGGSGGSGFSGTSTSGTSGFGGSSGTSPFGNSFSVFNTQSGSSGSSTGFSFGGFGAQPSDASAAQSSTGAFGSQASPSMSSGGFGPTSGFGSPTSPFGASSSSSTPSAAFTSYRK